MPYANQAVQLKSKERSDRIRRFTRLFFLGLLILELPSPFLLKKFGIKVLLTSEAEAAFPLCEDVCRLDFRSDPFKDTIKCDVACTIDNNKDGKADDKDTATTCGAAGYDCNGWGEPTPGKGGGGSDGGSTYGAIPTLNDFCPPQLSPLMGRN
jgi:hypothetical protein